MSSPSSSTLQELHRLDRSSPDFQGQLSGILYGQEYVRCVPNLQGDDLVWLVDYLDKVRCYVALSPHSPLKLGQAPDHLDPTSNASRKCLRELRRICSTRAILPSSYMLSSDLINVNSEPFASGGYGDIYHGTLDGSSVCIKRVRVYTKDPPTKAIGVRYWRCRFPRPPSLTKLTDLLQRGCNVETLETPKHLTPPGCYHHSPPTRFKLDVWWGPAGIHPETPQRRPACARGWRSCRVYPILTFVTRYPMSLRDSATSTHAMWFTGISRECVTVPDLAPLSC